MQELPGGGQGFARKARRKQDGRTAFLKTIKAKKKPERRARFSREATAYDTIRTRGIPRLIESNAHQWENDRVEPYIATEFIKGPTLRRWLEKQEHCEFHVAVETTRKLLAILSACHAGGIVHRDVKPDNIILADGDATRPWLLDFGLSYHRVGATDFKTEHCQEVGNRFLRLPELSAGSPSKQDPRSDFSFAGGILFYMLTSQNPDVLQDAEGRLPHQRQDNHSKIRRLAGPGLLQLLSLFDTAFAPQIADRFASAEVMLERLEGVIRPRVVEGSEEDLIKDIREIMDTKAAHRRANTHTRIDEALRHIQRVHGAAGKALGFPLSQSRSDWHISGTLGKNTLGWIEPSSNRAMLSVQCEVREAGEEIVISLSGEPVFRTSTTAPRFDEAFDKTIRCWLLTRLHNALPDLQRQSG